MDHTAPELNTFVACLMRYVSKIVHSRALQFGTRTPHETNRTKKSLKDADISRCMWERFDQEVGFSRLDWVKLTSHPHRVLMVYMLVVVSLNRQLSLIYH
jgi:hypothetical protein